MCFDKLPGKDSVCFVSQTRQEGMEGKKICFRSTAFLCSLRSVGTETQGETLKGRLLGREKFREKERTQNFLVFHILGALHILLHVI